MPYAPLLRPSEDATRGLVFNGMRTHHPPTQGMAVAIAAPKKRFGGFELVVTSRYSLAVGHAGCDYFPDAPRTYPAEDTAAP